MSGVGDQGLTPDYVHPQRADDGSQDSDGADDEELLEPGEDALEPEEEDAAPEDDAPSEQARREQHRIDPSKEPPDKDRSDAGGQSSGGPTRSSSVVGPSPASGGSGTR